MVRVPTTAVALASRSLHPGFGGGFGSFHQGMTVLHLEVIELKSIIASLDDYAKRKAASVSSS